MLFVLDTFPFVAEKSTLNIKISMVAVFSYLRQMERDKGQESR